MEWLQLHFISFLRSVLGFFLLAGLLHTSVAHGGGSSVDNSMNYDLNLVVNPPLAFIDESMEVKFSVDVLKRPEDVVNIVRLIQVDADGNAIAEIGKMTDDGQSGDLHAGDGQYALALIINESSPVSRYYQAVVGLENNSRQLLSEVETLHITEEASTKNPDEDKLVLGLGYPFPVNQAIVLLNENETKATAQALADLVSGKIVGYTPPINEYLIEVPATTVEELDAIIEKLERDPRVTAAMRNISMELE